MTTSIRPCGDSTGGRPLTPDLLRFQRDRVLAMAGELTVDRSTPAAVVVNAEVLTGWLEEATGPDDRRARFAGLQHACLNRSAERESDDDPQALIAEAQPFYAFIAADGDDL